MKPVHIGLIVGSAALAGGLAVKMSEVPAAPPRVPRVQTTAVAPSPAHPAPSPGIVKPAESVASAPAAVYQEAPLQTPVHASYRPKTADPPIVRREPAHSPPPRTASLKIARVTPAHSGFRAVSPVPYEGRETPEAGAIAPPEPEKQPEPPAPIAVSVSEPELSPQPEPAPRQVTIPAGAFLVVRLEESLSSSRAAVGDTFEASLADPLIIDGLIIAERGARVSGRVTDHQRAGRFGGSSLLQISLSSIETADGQRVRITTEPWSQRSNRSGGQQVAKIGGGAALGAIIGALAGGGAGAAIGAGIGGGAGVGAAALTPSHPVVLPSETVIRFRLASQVKITERRL